jgi:hypothetical protein
LRECPQERGGALRAQWTWPPGTGGAPFPPRENYQLATTKVYPVTLFRRFKPTDAYFALALTEAEPRLALTGHRLGEALNALLQ